MPRPIPHLRWWIGGLLFLSTVVNYIDRQALSVLAPFLKIEFSWSNERFALILIAFRVAYAVGQTVMGRLMDRLGTRRGLSITVLFYSLMAMATSMAQGLRSFCAMRFLLGAGESGNWPGASKAVSEWFPRRETGWAVALFDSGSAVGGAVAASIVLPIYLNFGWRPAFLLTGLLGLGWLVLFRWLYHPPETHPRLGEAERRLIMEGRVGGGDAQGRRLPYGLILKLPQTWAYLVTKICTDPVWFFIADWFAIYLVSKGFKLEEMALGFAVPFIAADLGNFFGGGVSSILIKRGWPVGRARKAIAIFGGLGMTLLVPTIWLDDLAPILACFGIATFAYAAFSTVTMNVPGDVFPSSTVASVFGMGGTAAGIGTIAAIYATGWVADRYSFAPILAVASFVPLAGTIAMVTLVRNTKETEAGLLHRV